MLVVLAYSHVDLNLAKMWLGWCKELDSTIPQHELLLIASSRISQDDVKLMHDLGREVFPHTNSIKQNAVNEGAWPKASNGMFRTALEWMKQFGRGHWLWSEPDLIPMVPRWLDMLDAEYRKHAKPFLGCTYDKPFRHINGCCIYPQNPGQFNHWIFGANEIPWDCIRPEITIRHAHITNLICRSLADPNKNQPHTFPDQSSLSIIHRGVVLFHGCKDGSLIDRIREQRGLVKPGFTSLFNTGIRKIFGNHKETISIRRTGAIGDSLAATCVATKLIEQGFKVSFQTHKTCQQVLKYVPGLTVTDVNGHCDIDLDLAYENDPERGTKHFADMFISVANRHLSKRKISLQALDTAPVIKVKEKDCQKLMAKYENMPHPWVGVIPKSNSFNVRTVPCSTWNIVSEYVHGTMFWMGTDPAPIGKIVDLGFRDITKVMRAIQMMDLVVGPDTGPIHMALAMNVPAIVIEQASSPDYHLPDNRDWIKIAPDNLSCLNCNLHVCRFDENHPPCQDIDPMQIAGAINRRLRVTEDVSCVIPVYRPAASMLNQCLTAILPQVGEVIVIRDQAGIFPSGVMQHPKVRYVTSWRNDIGFGRKLNAGFRHTNNQLVLSLNDDVVLEHDAVSNLVNVMKSDDKIGAVGHLLYYPGRKSIQHGGTIRTPGHIGWGHRDHNSPKPSLEGVHEMENCTGASLLIRRKAFYDVLGMPEVLKLYYEDNWFQLALRKAGWRVFYTSLAVGDHNEHSSTKITKGVESEVARSKELFTDKWREYFEWNRDSQLGNFEYLQK